MKDFINYVLVNYKFIFLSLLVLAFLVILVVVTKVILFISNKYKSNRVLDDSINSFDETVEYDAQFDKSKKFDYLEYKDYDSFDKCDFK